MKIKGILAIGVVSLALACTTSTENEGMQATTYTLDVASSSIEWKGMASPEYFHTGTVVASEGSVQMNGEELDKGSFVIDMSSIAVTDLEGDKKLHLEEHLKGTKETEDHKATDFFNINAYPNVEVHIGAYSDGKLNTTFMLLGKKMTQDLDVEMTHDENGASIKGDFVVDMSSLAIPGLTPDPETGEGISPKIEFSVDLKLKK